jgi:hypothetical protein
VQQTQANAAELLNREEQADLERVIAGRSIEATAAATEAYLAGRVAGLCREGALELASDAARVVEVQGGGIR